MDWMTDPDGSLGPEYLPISARKPCDADAHRHREWVAAWAEIGWHARTDIMLWLLEHALGRLTEAAINTARQQQTAIDNIAVDVKKLQHKVRS